MSTSEKKVWFITGASRGFGLQVTRDALQRGDLVVATARKAESIRNAIGAHDNLYCLPLDVTDEAQAVAAADAAVARFGRIDVLLNNAGYGLLRPLRRPGDRRHSCIGHACLVGARRSGRLVPGKEPSVAHESGDDRGLDRQDSAVHPPGRRQFVGQSVDEVKRSTSPIRKARCIDEISLGVQERRLEAAGTAFLAGAAGSAIRLAFLA